MNRFGFQKSRSTLGVLINQFDGRFQTRITRGLRDAAQEFDINLLFFSGRAIQGDTKDNDQYNLIYEIAKTNRLDGLIITSGTLSNYTSKENFLEFLEPFRYLPIVSLLTSIKGCYNILVDNRSGMKDILNHLVDTHGYKRIAYVGGPETNTEAQGRYAAYQEVLAENQIKFDPNLIYHGDFTFESGLDGIKELLDNRKADFDAIAVASDDMALSIIRELTRRGISVPQDIAITGFDDNEEMRLYMPPFTTFRQPLYELGKKAVEFLVSHLDGRDVDEETVLTGQLAVRESCGCFPLIQLKKELSIHYDESKPKATTPLSVHEALLASTADITTQMAALCPKSSEKKADFQKSIETLIESFSYSLQVNKKKDIFVLVLNDMIAQNKIGKDIHHWQDILIQFRKVLLSFASTNDDILQLETIFHQSFFLISQIMLQKESQYRRHADNILWNLRNIILQINSSQNLENLMDVLYEHLPGIGIKSCFISLFQNNYLGMEEYDTESLFENQDLSVSKQSLMVLAYDEKERFIKDQNYQNFNTKQLIPNQYIPESKRLSLLFLPLFNRENIFGTFTCELTSFDTTIYDTLREQISNALHTHLLLKIRKQSEEKLESMVNTLQKSEERFREMADLLPTIIIETDRDGVITFMNKAGFESFELTAEDLKNGAKLPDFVAPDNKKQFNDCCRAIFDDEQQIFDKFQFIKKSGPENTMICKAQPFKRNMRIEGIRWSILDIKPMVQSFILPKEQFFKKYKLSPREREVLSLILEGYTTREIGQKLYISEGTAKDHTLAIYSKIGVSSKQDLFNTVKEFQVSHFGYNSYIFTILSDLIKSSPPYQS